MMTAAVRLTEVENTTWSAAAVKPTVWAKRVPGVSVFFIVKRMKCLLILTIILDTWYIENVDSIRYNYYVFH